MKKSLLYFCCLLSLSPLYAQQTVTQYFESISTAFSQIEDYSAEWFMLINGVEQQAKVYYKSPDKILMVYSRPSGRFVLINSQEIIIFNQKNNIIFKQQIPETEPLVIGERSLSLLQANYSMRFQYPEGAEGRVLPDENSRVVSLILTPNNVAFGIADLEILFSKENNMMKRLTGTWFSQRVDYRFTNIVINQGLEDSLFNRPLPAGGKEWENFLQG